MTCSQSQSQPQLAPLLEYFDAFDGTTREFSEVEHLFDAVAHDEFTLVIGGRTLTRDEAKDIDAGYLAKGTQVTVVEQYRDAIHQNCIDTHIRAKNGNEEENIIHVVYSFEGDKIVRAQVMDD